MTSPIAQVRTVSRQDGSTYDTHRYVSQNVPLRPLPDWLVKEVQ